MVDSMLSGMVGRDEGLFIAITTAGAKPGGTLDQLEELWGRDPEAYIYRAGAKPGSDPHDPKVWLSANPAPWITEDKLRSQYRSLPLSSFMRYHLNLTPTMGDEMRAFKPELWNACADAPEIDTDLPCVIGVDAAPRRDKTAVVLDQRRPDGLHHVKSWVFEADNETGLLDFDDLKAVLHNLCQDFNVARIVVDPAHLFAIMDQLQKEGLPVEDYPQTTGRMVLASDTLQNLINTGRIRHGGDPMLTKHVLQAGAKEIPPSGWRLTKLSPTEHIDAAVALAMACHIAEAEWSRMGQTFSATGGLHSIDLML